MVGQDKDTAVVYRRWLQDSAEMHNKAPVDKMVHLCGSISFIISSKLGALVGLDIGLAWCQT